ncbi:MAG: hypothetical protein U5K79_06245 [Cyclobacteriaceae bacterium]|nr:hypothetical protein [Cyclobacteriaceae bacterium]
MSSNTFLSDSENGIKSQKFGWHSYFDLLFTLLHRRKIKEAEDFSTIMVMVAAKNLCSYVSLQLFLDPKLQNTAGFGSGKKLEKYK